MIKTFTKTQFLILLGLTFSKSDSFAQLTFQKTDYASGLGPQHTIFADLNKDGKPDMITANQNSNDISILFNTSTNGTASFSAKTDIATGSEAHSVSAADFNADGKLDLAAANTTSNTVSVLLNTTINSASSPTFATKLDLATLPSPYSVVTGDINGDGKQDIIAGAQTGGNAVSVFINQTATNAAAASFSSRFDFTISSTIVHITLADFNQDGKLDIAGAAGSGNGAAVYLNTTTAGSATPTFSAPTIFATGTSPWSVASGDLNKDGKMDMAVINRGGNSLSILMNTLSGSPATLSFTKTDIAFGSAPIGVIVQDMNNDNLADVVAVDRNGGKVSIFINSTTTGSTTPTLTKTDYAANSSPYFPAAADVNADGKMDLAVGNNGNNNVSLYSNATVLPVTLLAFSAKSETQGIMLNWSTAQEQNLSHYEILRSMDGINFQSIAKLKAKGDGTYSYLDKSTFNAEARRVYYQLVSEDADGAKKTSNIVSAKSSIVEEKLIIYPSIVSGNTITIDAPSSSWNQTKYFIYNMLGVIVKSGDITSDKQTVILSTLNAGRYIIKLSNGLTGQFVKQ